MDELRGIQSQAMPYELDSGSVDAGVETGDDATGRSGSQDEDEGDDDELSTTSGRRHGALLQPEEADLIIFEVRSGNGPGEAD